MGVDAPVTVGNAYTAETCNLVTDEVTRFVETSTVNSMISWNCSELVETYQIRITSSWASNT